MLPFFFFDQQKYIIYIIESTRGTRDTTLVLGRQLDPMVLGSNGTRDACFPFKQLLYCYWIISLTLSYTFHVLLLFNGTQCRAFAKALHYKEMEFEGARSKKMDANPVAVVEALIHINNQLHQHEVELNRNDFF